MRHKIILVFFFLFFQIIYPQDIKLKLPESSIQNLCNALIQSRYLSYGKIDQGAFVQYYSVKPKSLTIDIQPNGLFGGSLVIDASANFNFGIFNFDLNVSNIQISLWGNINVIALTNGYKIKFIPTGFVNPGDWLGNALNNSSSGLLNSLPEISTTVKCSLMPVIFGQYFTSAVPTLTTTNNEVILSLTLLEGPRYITVFNEVNQRWDIGDIEHDENGTYVSYPSPKTFEWYTGEIHKVQTPLALLDATNGKNKYKHWLDGEDLIQSEIFTRRIEVNVGNNDELRKAVFPLAKRVQLSNLLEGSLTGGTVTYDGTTTAVFDDYDFYHELQQHSIYTQVPTGTHGANWNFYGWSDGVTTPQRTVIVNNNINLTANYKGTQLSTQTDAFDNSSQRKFIKTSDGVMHHVYESMGKVWYEKSTNG